MNPANLEPGLGGNLFLELRFASLAKAMLARCRRHSALFIFDANRRLIVANNQMQILST